MSHNYHQFLASTELGGAGLTALRIAEDVRRRGLGSHVWVPGVGRAWREAEQMGLTPREFKGRVLVGSSKLRALAESLRVARHLRNLSPGLVHVHSLPYYRLLLPGLVLSGLRRVAHVQLEESQEMMRWVFRNPPDLIITCSRSLVAYVRSCLRPRHQERQWIETVPNAVDTNRFRPVDRREAKQRVGAPAGTPLALMLANLAPHKGQETTIRAVAALKARGIELTCWLAGTERGGEGDYTRRLRSLIEQLGVLDRVRLLGYRDDADALLQAADVFLLPSTNEGLPLSIVEAQATKVPVLAAPTAGIPEVVADGETGFLIAADDAEGYASRLETLLGDDDLSHRVADRAYDQAVRDYNWDSYCKRIARLYEAVLEERAGDRHERQRSPQRASIRGLNEHPSELQACLPLCPTGDGLNGRDGWARRLEPNRLESTASRRSGDHS